jgi:hypothetical protein
VRQDLRTLVAATTTSLRAHDRGIPTDDGAEDLGVESCDIETDDTQIGTACGCDGDPTGVET